VVTGATGFVGRALLARLAASVDTLRFGADDWKDRLASAHLEGATIFHLAGRAHMARRGEEEVYERDNAAKTRALAEAAVREGARRLVFVSSIKIHGEESGERPFQVDDPPAPEDAYARSKVAAEQALASIANEHRLDTVIVRPPLVYGPGASGNLAALVRLADTPWPLPFASLDAPRSFVHVDDLARLLVACGEQPGAAGRAYIAASPETVSASRLVTLMRRALGRAPRMVPVPRALLEGAASIVGKGEKIRRLSRPLVGDAAEARRELGWAARVPIEQAVEEMVRDYRAKAPQ
jgi:nucleoside-diphosphate-sugar epimerase